MSIREKIYYYLEQKNLKVQDFAEMIDINRVTVSAMLNERNRFSQDFFEALPFAAPDIDLNVLCNKNIDKEFIFKEVPVSNEEMRRNELEAALRDIKKILAKTKI